MDARRDATDPQAALDVVLEGLLNGGHADPHLIAALSTSPLADLSDYPQRAEVWSLVKGESRDKLLVATVVGWLHRVTSGKIPPSPERSFKRPLWPVVASTTFFKHSSRAVHAGGAATRHGETGRGGLLSPSGLPAGPGQGHPLPANFALIYRVRRGDIVYRDPGATSYVQLHRARLINNLRRRAKEFGLSLIKLETGEVLDHAVVPPTVF